MFVHDRQLQYVLTPDQYYTREQHQREVASILKPAWHLVGSAADLPRHGDFCTFDLLGEPLILRNEQGRYHALLNVCSHRHCRLTSRARGNARYLECQYHGWQYSATGRTRRIPEAQCFRPFDRQQAHLHRYPLQQCGDLLFVSLVDDPPPLAEFLGHVYPLASQRFCRPYAQNWSWEFSFNCNWKLPLENTLESYHIRAVHPRSFGGIYPTENAMTHILADRFTSLEYDVTEDRRATAWQRWAMSLLGGTSTDVYRHEAIHPNLVVVVTDVFAYAQSYIPTGPKTSRTTLRMYTFRGTRRNPLARWVAWISAMQLRRDVLRIMTEDAAVCAQQQLGLESSPFRGCIGTREERIYAFQAYVQQHCADSGVGRTIKHGAFRPV